MAVYWPPVIEPVPSVTFASVREMMRNLEPVKVGEIAGVAVYADRGVPPGKVMVVSGRTP